ncbi:DNA methyltransferase [Agrococcus beijingensis]|uniref:DNA methyltransferase n=1 Tax=Agrococcus beijingensis TaxID=3068634 RepID=UPI002742467D|nr:DNA methyltransferase [Agrococcus sp. REN33]
MAVRSGAEIQHALTAFVSKWKQYQGSERAEAQTFLNELYAAYGTDRTEAGAKFEDFKTSAGFMDLHQPGVLIVEMKKPGRSLEEAAEQRRRYWQESSDHDSDTPAARWVIASNFHEFEIWEPGRFPNNPRARFTLEELPDHYDALLFLQSESIEPVFSEHRRELTTDAARHIADLYRSMADRGAAPLDEIQRFTMQLVWTLFAEDLGMLDGYPLQQTVERLLREEEPDSSRDLGHLFKLLNQKGDQNRRGVYAGTRYVNGELFAKSDAVYLTRDELVHLKRASEFDWRQVNPTIFGSLLEGVLGDEQRASLGAHYTHEADIMKIVTPTIVRPWRERIEATSTSTEARELLDELCGFRVLDPACGCGNFLYVAYRELRGLEAELKARVADLAARDGLPKPKDLPFYPLANVQGIDIEQVAVQIARVVLWMGHRQMVDRYGEAEPVLPLQDLSAIRAADALRTEWPETDAIIGNPPFLGAKLIRPSLGDGYADWLISRFGVGVKDLCVYWFRKAHEHLQSGQRAGLVATNSISQTAARQASLDFILSTDGVITSAVSSQKWPGDAKVHVSIVNWRRGPRERDLFELDGREVVGISASLVAASASSSYRPAKLVQNLQRCFAGVVPQGRGFVIDEVTAQSLLEDPQAHYRDVVKPFLTGQDLVQRPRHDASRWIIDFASLSLEEAMRYPRAIAHLRDTTKIERESSSNRAVEPRWWLFGRRVEGMRSVVAGLSRFAAAAATSKRLELAWVDAATCPNNATIVFGFDDDYSFGVLASAAHEAWAWAQSSTLKGDLRYTNAAVFETLPWPESTQAQRHAIGEASRALYARRSELCIEHDMGLTKLYNLMDDGAFQDLAALHKRLDEAVVTAYGWPKSIAQDADALVARLTERNREIAEGERPYAPFREH